MKKILYRLTGILIAITISLSLVACGNGSFDADQLSDENISEGSGQVNGQTQVHFLDVGQGDSTLIMSDGEAALIDAGDTDDGGFIVGYLKEHGIEELKYVIFTHPDSDHIGSGQDVIRNFKIGTIFLQQEAETWTAETLLNDIGKLKIKAKTPKAGEEFKLGDSLIKIIGPIKDYDDTNSNSICIKLIHGEISYMFTGDAGINQEDDMIDAGTDMESTVLKAGHHGSSSSNGYRLFREVYPDAVVISCGANNSYGHPHEETLSKISDLGAVVYRTDAQGTIIASDDGTEVKFNVPGKGSNEKAKAAAADEAAIIGNINSKVYHNPYCGGLPAEHNRVYFKDEATAEGSGYRPCQNCH